MVFWRAEKLGAVLVALSVVELAGHWAVATAVLSGSLRVVYWAAPWGYPKGPSKAEEWARR